MAIKNRSAERESYWRLALEEFGASGLSVRAFCVREGLAEASFYAWRRTLRKRGVDRPSSGGPRGAELVPVEVIEANDRGDEEGSAPCLMEVATPGGFTLRFPADVPPRQLAAALAAIVGDAAC
ncbi:MAG: hypothetical protein KF688_19520 [Pirellulales bacterium]|nr:hypothetical protein [Pirellulales bacterium]